MASTGKVGPGWLECSRAQGDVVSPSERHTWGRQGGVGLGEAS